VLRHRTMARLWCWPPMSAASGSPAPLHEGVAFLLRARAAKLHPNMSPSTYLASSLLTPFRSAKHSTRTVAVPSAQGRTVRAQGLDGPRPDARRGGALCTGADGPRAETGRSATWCEARASLPDGRTVRAYAEAAEAAGGGLDLAPGRDPVREERS
jgi:hypothetical protein